MHAGKPMDSDRTVFCGYNGIMHIGIDVREACSPVRTGKGQWTHGFVTELLKRNIDLTLFTDTPLPDEWKTLIVSHRGVCAVHKNELKGLSWHRDAASHFLKKKDIDAYLSPVSFIVPFLVGKKKKCIPVVHDLIAFRGEPHDRKAVFIERLTLKRAVKSAPLVLTVSETSKRDLLARYPFLSPEKVATVFAGSMPPPVSRQKEGFSVVMVSTLSPRKNQKRLIEAYAGLPEDLRKKHPLILIGGRGWNDGDIVSLAQKTDGVEWKGYVSEAEREVCLAGAMVVALPSLYEGFGLPILDAMNAGVPVLTSDIGSMKEVAGDAAMLVDPESVESIRAGLSSLLTDKALRDSLRQKGTARAKEFSWKRSADLFLDALQRAETVK